MGIIPITIIFYKTNMPNSQLIIAVCHRTPTKAETSMPRCQNRAKRTEVISVSNLSFGQKACVLQKFMRSMMVFIWLFMLMLVHCGSGMYLDGDTLSYDFAD